MKVYLDLVFFINFMFDLLLLLTVGIECKIFPKKRYLILGAFVGSLTTFLLFLPLNNLLLFFFKIIASFFMLITTFNINNRNLFITLLKSLYGNSIILGGLIYYLNNQFSNVNLIIILIGSPIIFYLYHKSLVKERVKRELLHHVSIKYNNKLIELLGYLDTGNNIRDPYKKRPIIIVSDKYFSIAIEKAILVPFKTIGDSGLLRCVEIEELIVDGRVIDTKYLIASSKRKIDIKGASCILPNKIEEEL